MKYLLGLIIGVCLFFAASPIVAKVSHAAIDLTATGLYVTGKVTATGRPSQGNAITFSGKVTNIGTTNAAASVARFRLDLNNDGTWDSTYYSIRSASYAKQIVAGRFEWESNGQIASPPAGTHKVELCADYLNVNTDSNLANNCTTVVFTIDAQNPSMPSQANGLSINHNTCGPYNLSWGMGGGYTDNILRQEGVVIYQGPNTSFVVNSVDGYKATIFTLQQGNAVGYYAESTAMAGMEVAGCRANNLVDYIPTLTLTDASGNATTTFTPNQSIYVRVAVQNAGYGSSPSGAVAQVYKNQTSVSQGTTSDITGGFNFTQGVLSGGQTVTYESFAGGQNVGSFGSTKSWSQSTVGTYTALVYVNYNDAMPEDDITNNQATVSYTISTPPATPTNLSESYSCLFGGLETFNWTNAADSANYNIQIDGVTTNNIGDANSYSKGFASNTSHSWALQAVGAGGLTSAFTTTRNFTTSVCAPGTPSSLTTSSLTCSSVTVSWSAGSGATDYELTYTPSGGSAVVTGGIATTSQNLTGLTGNKAYTWSVRSHNSAGYSASVSGPGFTTLTCAPGVPSGLTTSSLTCSSVTVSWSGGSNATDYELTYTPSGGSAIVTGGIVSTSQNLTGLTANKAYTWSVRSHNSAGYSASVSGPGFTTLTCAPGTPSSLTTSSLGCNFVTLGWTAGSNATDYELTYTPSGGSAVVTGGIAATGQGLTGLQENTSYTWSVRSHNASGYSAPVSGPGFTTSSCLHFTMTATGPSNITPGTTQHPSITLAYQPSNAAWTAQGGQVTVGILKVVTAPANCSSYTNPASFDNTPPANSQLTAKMTTNQLSSITVSAGTSPVSLDVVVQSTAPSNTYTICLGGSSAQSPDQLFANVQFTVKRSPWVQIGGSDPTASFAGDVHSNASISNIILPSSPAQQYFYKSPSAGVISSTGTISVANSQASSVIANNWLWSAYPQILTPDYNALYTDAPVVASAQVTPGVSPSAAQVTTACTNGGNTYYQAGGSVTIAAGSPIAFGSNCDSRNLVYFVPGNLTVNADIKDTSTTGTMTFIIHGNLTVSPNVVELDGMYIFDGAFSDGTGDNSGCAAATSPDCQLVVKGSLIGLSGSSPTASGGAFASGGVSGFQRDLGASNDTMAAEVVNYQPKYLFQTKNALGGSTFTWTE